MLKRVQHDRLLWAVIQKNIESKEKQVLLFLCQKNKSAVICRIGVICVPLLNGEYITRISRISQNYTLNLCGIGAICVSKKPRTLHADVPTPSLLITHYSLQKNCSYVKSHRSQLIAHNSKICRIGVICVPLKNERRILHKVEAIHCGMKGDSWAK